MTNSNYISKLHCLSPERPEAHSADFELFNIFALIFYGKYFIFITYFKLFKSKVGDHCRG